MSAGTPPTIPSSLQIYNSYVEDPIWQGKFTTIWCSILALAIAASVPSLVRSLRNGRSLKGFFGVSEDLHRRGYTTMTDDEKLSPPRISKASKFWYSAISVRQWTLPYVELNAGQLFILASYLALTRPLVSNPNRAGFLALAQFPIVFLFATKNSILSLLLGPGNGYEKLNFLHRMAGRLMFLGGCIHGSLWIRNHLQYGLPILGQQKETSGVASLTLLCIIVLSSLRPVRRMFYELFFLVHVLIFVAFFVTVCYHTIYASPWIFPPLAFYGADMLLRMLRYRFKDATLTAQDNFMTMVRINDCDDGWLGGQHVRLRVFFSGRVLESHPLTILSAPPSHSCLSNPGMILGSRVNGDWTRALNDFTRKEQERLQALDKTSENASVPIQVMLDGPYGGSSVDLGQFESALLVAGGAGVTFTLGPSRRHRGQMPDAKIEFAWCIRSFGHIAWFAPMLMDIAKTALKSSIDLHISVFVTCLCDPEAIPPIPNSDVTMVRPSVHALLQDLTNSPSASYASSVEEKGEKQAVQLDWVDQGGGVAVCACGPESLTREAQNAVARLGVRRGLELGGVAIHVENFTL
ncbi:iron reductase [Melanogaster broomeanus]|nr:iron reductase [Melanogaster broomeanus]